MADSPFKVLSFRADSFITIEGKANSTEFFILKSGKVRLTKESSVIEDPTLQAILGPGDFFGVVSCMSAHGRLETAIAVSDVVLIGIPRDHFGTLIQKNAPIAMKIIRLFSKRLRFYDSELGRLTTKNAVVGEDVENLFHIGEYYFKTKKFNYASFVFKKYLRHCPNGAQLSTAKIRLQAMGIGDEQLASNIEMPSQSLTKSFPNDTMIFSENEPGNELYIIQQGKVKITKIINEKEILIAVLKPGDMFGEMALLEDKPRTASAIAFGDTVLLSVNKANFEVMVVQKPQIATRLIQLLSERIWKVYKQLANVLLRSPIARLYDNLLTQVESLRIPVEHRASHTFDLGPKELIGMLGFSEHEGEQLVNELLQNKKFMLVNGKLHCNDLEELKKQVDYYKKMEEMERKRERSASGQ